jgi:hypothetical protein
MLQWVVAAFWRDWTLHGNQWARKVLQQMMIWQRSAESMWEIVFTQYALKDIDEEALFCIVQAKKTLALKGERCWRAKGYTERMTILLCCSADAGDILCPLTVRNQGLGHYPCGYESSKTTWLTVRLFSDCSVLKGKWLARRGLCFC